MNNWYIEKGIKHPPSILSELSKYNSLSYTKSNALRKKNNYFYEFYSWKNHISYYYLLVLCPTMILYTCWYHNSFYKQENREKLPNYWLLPVRGDCSPASNMKDSKVI
jgi:hypothetical protein